MLIGLNKQKGVTFVEMMVYIAIFAIVFIILTGFIVWTYQANIKFQAMRETENNAQRVMRDILKEIRQARSIYTPTSPSSQLSLETTAYLPTGEISTYVDIFLCGSQLCFKRESQNPFAVSSSGVIISNLKFVQFQGATSSPAVQVSFSVNHISPSVDSYINATSSAVLRNY